MKHRQSWTELCFHIVFATHERLPLIATEAHETLLRGVVIAKTNELGGWVHAFGAWVDHVHMLVRLPPTLAVATYTNQIKGRAAWVWNENKNTEWGQLNWQDGYFARTADSTDMATLVDYIRNQRTRHTAQQITSHLEPYRQR